MEYSIPNSFDNFKQRMLQRGMETSSTTEYKGFEIFLRAYPLSGIYYRIFKVDNGQRKKIRGRAYNFKLPELLLQEAKDYIDETFNK